jgi:hypothetical protein
VFLPELISRRGRGRMLWILLARIVHLERMRGRRRGVGGRFRALIHYAYVP